MDDAISEKWIKAAVLRNLLKSIIKDIAMQLRDAKTVNKVRNVINIYIYIYIYTNTKLACRAARHVQCSA